MAGDGMDRKWVLPALLLLLVCARAQPVLALGEVFFHGEELARGAAAEVMLRHPPLPHHQLQAQYYEGGAFVAAQLDALLFVLVGHHLLAHKLAAILWSALILACGFRLAQRHFGRGAAAAFGLLLIFAPESVQKISLLHLGTHWESSLFVLLVLDGALGIGSGARARPVEFARTGFAAGLGTYFSFQVPLLTAPALAWCLWRARRSLLGRHGALGLAGLLAGLLPLLILLVLVGRSVFGVHGQSLVARADNISRLGAMMRSLIEGRSPREVASALCVPLLSIGAIAWLFRSREPFLRQRAIPLAACLLAWTAVYATSTFVQGEVYHPIVLARLAPAWMVALLLCAAVLGRLADDESRARSWIARALLASFAILGAADLVAIVRAGKPGSPAANLELLCGTKGYSYARYFALILPHLQGSEAARIGALASIGDDRRLLYGDLATAAFVDGGRRLDSILEVIDSVDPAGRADFLEGLGPWLAERSLGDPLRALELASEAGPEHAEALAEAAGRFGGGWRDDAEQLQADIVLVLGRPGAAAWLRGAGHRILRRHVLSPYGGPRFLLRPEAALELIESQDPEAAVHLRAGFEEARDMLAL